ncbi:MAG: PilZ domain-containing protein [Phycisphaerales bacterium]|nr:MAG: PilZ domain-containing protein [Phycisphaerales bacterium]
MLAMSRLVPIKSEARVVDHRKSPRLAPEQGHFPVIMLTEDGRRFESDLCDISSGGIGVSGGAPVKPGERVRLGIRLSENVAPYDVAAEVVHQSADHIGLRYVI